MWEWGGSVWVVVGVGSGGVNGGVVVVVIVAPELTTEG